MSKYQEFLNECNIISEDKFNEIIDSLPEFNMKDLDLSELDYVSFRSQDEISKCIINSILYDWNYVFVDNINFKEKTMELFDVDSIEDLESIKNKFSKWTITNYEEIKIEILEAEKDIKRSNEYCERKSISDYIIKNENIPLNDLREFIKKYDL